MEINQLLQACEWASSSFLIFSGNVFSPLIYYSHLLPVALSLVIGGVLYFGNRKALPNKALWAMVLLFSLWIFGDLVLWATPSPHQTMFFWSLVNMIEPLVYIAAVYFISAFITKRLPPMWIQIILLGLMIPIFVFTPTSYGLSAFDLTNCDREAVEGILVYYGYAIEILMTLGIVIYGIVQYRMNQVTTMRHQIVLSVLGLVLFLISFASGNIIGSLSVDWTLAQVGLFGLPVFVFFLAVLIVKYQAFHTKIFSSQILVFMIWVLIGSLFLVQDPILIKSIVGMTLVIMIVFGMLLIRSVRNEIEQKEILETLKGELEAKNEKLKTLDATKNEFLSFATHQLRSPLTSIKWGLNAVKETLVDKHADAETTSVVTHLSGTTDDLISTVNDLLDISKIEQGGLVMKPEDFDVYDLTARLAEEFKMSAQKKGLKLEFTGTVAPCIITGDQNKLRQVIVNLIDNAIKYTATGTITVAFKNQGNRAAIMISDTGPGIAREELEKLFTKFIRGAAGKASQGGSGLGLYLAKKIVDMHGGKISASSDGLGKGSTFSIELPIG